MHSVPLGSVESLRLSYKTGLNRLFQGYATYLHKNVQETEALGPKKPKAKAPRSPKPTNTSSVTNVISFSSLPFNVSLVSPADKMNDTITPNSTTGNNRGCETDAPCEDFGPNELKVNSSTPERMRNTNKLNSSTKYEREEEEEEGTLGLLVIEPQRNVSHNVQHHPCEAQAIQQALVTRIMNSQDLERNRDFFLYPSTVLDSLLRQRDDFVMRRN